MQKFRVYQPHKVSILMLSATGKGTWTLPGTLKCLSQSPSPVSTQAHLFPKGDQYPNSCHQALGLAGLLQKQDRGACAVWSLTSCAQRNVCEVHLRCFMQKQSICLTTAHSVPWSHSTCSTAGAHFVSACPQLSWIVMPGTSLYTNLLAHNCKHLC